MICFCPDGTIPIVFVNVPGAVHDSQVADYGNIFDKLESVYERDGGKCTVDSAFGNATRDYLKKTFTGINSYQRSSGTRNCT